MSKKSGPLNKAEKFYLDNNEGSAKEFAEDLNRSEKMIKDYLKTSSTASAKKEGSENSHTVGNLMGNHTGSGRKGISVMTPAASELSDAGKKTKPVDRSGHVWKIKNDD